MTAVTKPRPIVASGPWLPLQSRLLGNEVTKSLRLAWRRRSMVIVGMIMNLLTYLGISLFIGGGRLVEELMILTFPALLAVIVAASAAIQGSGGIAEEINGGTLEQAQLSPASSQAQVIGRILALGIEALIAAAIAGVVLQLAVGLAYEVRPAALIPILLTIADAFGYALLITALTVRVASIGAITHVFNMVIMVFGGMIVPITVFPEALETFARFIPTALGVQATNAVLAGESLSATWADGTLPWLVVHAAALFALGLVIWVVNIRHALREGGLSPR